MGSPLDDMAGSDRGRRRKQGAGGGDKGRRLGHEVACMLVVSNGLDWSAPFLDEMGLMCKCERDRAATLLQVVMGLLCVAER